MTKPKGDLDLDVTQKLAEVVAKVRIDGLGMVSPTLTANLLKTFAELQSKVSRDLKSVGSTMFGVDQMMKGYRDALAEAAVNCRLPKELMGISRPLFTAIPEEFKSQMRRTMNRLPEALKIMADAGWPLDFDITPAEAVDLADALDQGYTVEVDRYMGLAIESQLDEIFEMLHRRHPTRVHILQEIRKCFEQEMYFVAINGVLSQIDGICDDFTSNVFFQNENKKPKVANYLFTTMGQSSNWLLGPISSKPVISFDEKHEILGQLNRHRVMHGKDLTYGSKLNFFKSISWLKYLSDVVYFESGRSASSTSSTI